MYGRMRTAQLHPGFGATAPEGAEVTQPAGSLFTVSWYAWLARAICFKLLPHFIRAAASRTFWTAGSSRPMRIAMIAMTTNSSISVNARRDRERYREETM